MNRTADEELERLKSDIKLHEYAASLGYEIDLRESSKREIVMRQGDDKISVRVDAKDNHYVYFSFRKEGDSGTILDFVMRRLGKNFGEARKVLRPWLGSSRPQGIFEHLEPAEPFNRAAVQAAWIAMKELRWHDYLERDRALPRHILGSPRFKGTIRVDARANAIFPHRDDEGICGFEKRNRHFKGFAELGEKGLWMSAVSPEDRALVIGESAIDGISHACLFPAPARYASIAGGMNSKQPGMLAAACAEMPPGSEIICITHADPAGENYAAVIREAAGILPFRLHRPAGAKDWNDVLQTASDPGLHPFPAVR